MSFATPTPLVQTESYPVAGPIAVGGSLRFADLELVAVEGADHAHLEISATGSRAEDLLASVQVVADSYRLSLDVPLTWGILGPRATVRIRLSVPAGSTLDLSSGSGDLTALGGYAVATLHTGSGDLRLERAETASLHSGSGDVNVNTVALLNARSGSGDIRVDGAGTADLRAGSGSITLGQVSAGGDIHSGSGRISVAHSSGDLKLVTGSGAITVGSTDGEVHAKSGSGSLTVENAAAGRLRLASSSGRLRIGVAYGTAALIDASSSSGRVTSELESLPGSDGFERTLEVHARSSSGSITISRAQ